jgi:hypothetical protein
MPWSAIFSGTGGADIPSLRTFLEILSGNGPEYDSDDIDYYAPPCMCYYIDGIPSLHTFLEILLSMRCLSSCHRT